MSTNRIGERTTSETEALLNANAATLRGILNATQESIWLFRPDGTILLANETALSRLKKSSEDVIGKNFALLVPKELVEPRQRCLDQVVETGQPVEYMDERAGIVFRHTFYPVKDADGRVVQIATFSRDITERRRAEENLRVSEERYRNIVETTSEGIWIAQPDGKTIFVNQKMADLLGYRPEEMLGRDGSEFLSTSDRSAVHSRRAEIAQGKDISPEIEFLHKDGHSVWTIATVSRLHDSEGRHVANLSMHTDITERKRTEEELVLAHLQVVDEKKNLEAVLKVLPIGVAILDERGGDVQANDAYEQIWGGPRPQVETVDDYSPYKAWWVASGKRVEPHEWASARAIEKGETVIGQVLEIERFDGTHAFILNSGVPIRDEQGRITGSAVAIMDITALRHAENELIAARESLRRANLELQEALVREQHLARTDGLTGTHNRRSFLEFASHAFVEAKRYLRPLSIILFDVDHFKKFNDTYGHQVGDEILICLSQLVGRQLRDTDILARHGGEEFVILLPNSDAQEAAVVSERIREAVHEYRLDTETGKVGVTISMGLAQCLESTATLDDLIRQADQAMYAAKARGRDCVVVYHEMDEGGER